MPRPTGSAAPAPSPWDLERCPATLLAQRYADLQAFVTWLGAQDVPAPTWWRYGWYWPLPSAAPPSPPPPFRICCGRDYRGWVSAPAQIAVLVLGPPRSGKTRGLIIPNVAAWEAPSWPPPPAATSPTPPVPGAPRWGPSGSSIPSASWTPCLPAPGGGRNLVTLIAMQDLRQAAAR